MTLLSRALKTTRLSLALVLAFGVVGCADAGTFEEALTENADSAESPLFWCNPKQVVDQTLSCIEAEDAECAASGYAADFVKLHNGVPTDPVPTFDPAFWGGAFQIIDIELDTNHFQRVGGWGDRQVSIRYVEKVTTILGEVILQHEHALVTVDENCQMSLWDQYGDNAEQTAVDEAVERVLAVIGG